MALFCGDSLDYLHAADTDMFSCAVFSPPYSATPSLFDVRTDFAPGGRFQPWAKELSRTCSLWAINLGQIVHDGRLLPFTEQLVHTVEEQCSAQLFDRWVMLKNSWRPFRGNRALSRFEFVLLFARQSWKVMLHPEVTDCLTAFNQTFGPHHQRTLAWKRAHGGETIDLTSTPYSPAIPHRVLSAYAMGDPRPVLDPFCGTGTTLAVARELGLDYVGIDIEPANIDLCRELGL